MELINHDQDAEIIDLIWSDQLTILLRRNWVLQLVAYGNSEIPSVLSDQFPALLNEYEGDQRAAMRHLLMDVEVIQEFKLAFDGFRDRLTEETELDFGGKA